MAAHDRAGDCAKCSHPFRFHEVNHVQLVLNGPDVELGVCLPPLDYCECLRYEAPARPDEQPAGPLRDPQPPTRHQADL